MDSETVMNSKHFGNGLVGRSFVGLGLGRPKSGSVWEAVEMHTNKNLDISKNKPGHKFNT